MAQCICAAGWTNHIILVRDLGLNIKLIVGVFVAGKVLAWMSPISIAYLGALPVLFPAPCVKASAALLCYARVCERPPSPDLLHRGCWRIACKHMPRCFLALEHVHGGNCVTPTCL